MEFVEPEEAGPTEESGDEAVTDEETDLGTDWETVPSPRFCDIPSQVGTLFKLLKRLNNSWSSYTGCKREAVALMVM